jgi:hypothetical protein
MRVPCQSNESASAAGRADDEMDDTASTIANAIHPVPSMSRGATLASIHCGRLMVRALLQGFVATLI